MLCMTVHFYGNVHTQILLDTKYLQIKELNILLIFGSGKFLIMIILADQDVELQVKNDLIVWEIINCN